MKDLSSESVVPSAVLRDKIKTALSALMKKARAESAVLGVPGLSPRYDVAVPSL